eukprot:9249787-Prorocentrum_lima.AAC.1
MGGGGAGWGFVAEAGVSFAVCSTGRAAAGKSSAGCAEPSRYTEGQHGGAQQLEGRHGDCPGN